MTLLLLYYCLFFLTISPPVCRHLVRRPQQFLSLRKKHLLGHKVRLERAQLHSRQSRLHWLFHFQSSRVRIPRENKTFHKTCTFQCSDYPYLNTHRTNCWHNCALASNGYIHGWQTARVLPAYECRGVGRRGFVTNGATSEVQRGHGTGEDPCHPHFQVHWEMWTYMLVGDEISAHFVVPSKGGKGSKGAHYFSLPVS